MINHSNIWRSLLFLLAALPLAISSCKDADNPTVIGTDGEGEEIELTVPVMIPSHEDDAAQLRSIGTTEENTISSMYILAFRVAPDGKEYFDYYAKSSKDGGNTEGANTQKFRIVAWTRAYQQRFVVITNAGDKLNAIKQTPSDWKDTEKNAMLALLKFDLNAGSLWNTLNASNYTALPMWGESDQVMVTATTTSLPSSVKLLRMVAKINVQLDETVTGLTGKFQIKDVRLYNTNTQGNIVPDADAISNGRVTAPTIPANAGFYPGPLVYSDFTSPGKTDVAMVGTIYTFETAKPADNDRLKATGLVIGGLYENDTQETYYRVDFLNSDKTFRDILRNYLYQVSIVAINGRGHDTPEEAWEGKGVNMEADILLWDDSSMDNVVVDEQYFLSVSHNEIIFSIDASAAGDPNNILKVLTNYSTSISANSGWKVVSMESLTTGVTTSWLTLTDAQGRTNLNAHGDANVTAQCTFSYTKNPTGNDRSVKLTIAAGRLHYPVIVTQNTLERAMINFYQGENPNSLGEPITNDTLVFHNLEKSKGFSITWTPENADLLAYEDPSLGDYLVTNVTYPLQLLRAGSSLLTYGPGKYSYHVVLPSQVNVNGASTSYVFIVSNGVQTTEKRLVVYYTTAP